MSAPSSEHPSSEHYTWTAPNGAAVLIRFDVIERMSMDIMQGFGSVPKRGAEVGGLLLGRLVPTETGSAAIHIEDFRVIPCEYRRGPSYLLSENDTKAFDEILREAHAREDPKPVGVFRSHTRDAPGLTAEDVEFCGQRFPDPWSVFLLVKPRMMSVSQAGFVLKRDGQFPEGPPEFEFPFRRRELDPRAAGERPRRRQEPEQAPEAAPTTPVQAAPVAMVWQTRITPLSPEIHIERRSHVDWLRSVWWVVLLLILGGAAGYLLRICLGDSQPWRPNAYRLNLSLRPSGSSLAIHWDGSSPAVASASRGQLVVDDGGQSQTIPLERSELSGGVLVFQRTSSPVQVRLEVFPAGRATISESARWSQ